MNFVVDGTTSQGRPKLRRKNVVKTDLHKKCLNLNLASNSLKWKNAIRPVTQPIGLKPTMSGTWRETASIVANIQTESDRRTDRQIDKHTDR